MFPSIHFVIGSVVFIADIAREKLPEAIVAAKKDDLKAVETKEKNQLPTGNGELQIL